MRTISGCLMLSRTFGELPCVGCRLLEKRGAGGSGFRLKPPSQLSLRALTHSVLTAQRWSSVTAGSSSVALAVSFGSSKYVTAAQNSTVFSPFACLSSVLNASMMSSNRTGAPCDGARSSCAASIAQASDAHDARIARFSLRVRSGSSITSEGCPKAFAG